MSSPDASKPALPLAKRAVDVVLSAAALVVLSPVFAAVAVLVRLFIGSPVFFRQERPGRGEKPFQLIKFRTMTTTTGADGDLLSEAERMTELGRVLRAASLDELPELWNVFRGDMSVVGPRPLLMRYLPYYTEEERVRHSFRPGITGLAQIEGRNQLAWSKRLALDVWYVRNWSLWLDAKIILRTILKVVRGADVEICPSEAMQDLDVERGARR